MTKYLSILAAAALVTGLAASSFAGSKCCPLSKKTSAKAENTKIATADCGAKEGCWDVFAKLDLSDDQKTKLAELKGDCDATKCSITSRQKMIEGAKSILTAEQLEECKSRCAKSGAKDCPMQSAQKESGKKS